MTKEIKALRKERGHDKEREWDIWRDGCEGGEYVAPCFMYRSNADRRDRSPQEVTARIDALIKQIRELQAPHMKDAEPKDVILVAHGHLTRAFAKRWLGYELSFPLSLMMEPGGVGILSYQHHSIDEPALLLGIGFPQQ